ncbi:MAG: DUF6600 domain-containing protein [Caldimonas sp.]
MNRTRFAASSPAWARLIVVALSALLFLGVAIQARAQSTDADPPGRVARLSEVNGQVWLFSPDADEWVGVERNRPLTTGDRVATDNGARAEITLGSTTLRLDSATELEIVQLDDSRYIVHLHSGSVAARLRNNQAIAEFALETDEGSFRAEAVGRYRFDRFEQTSDLTVTSGQAVFEGRNSALPLTAGQHAQFWLDSGGAAQYNMVEPARDSFAGWNDERDRAEERPVAVRYVSPEMTGAEDLDRYGAWEQTPEYGPIWTPRAVAPGWAPYSAGHWAWVRPWGWTWVDEAPWGFAPFHYGRWVYHRNAWCWAPGTYVARPVYAPALVAWIGGPRVGVSVSIGGGGPPVGWFPLAPHEVYVPSYRSSPRYIRNVNVTHVTNVTNITTIVNNTNGAADRRDFANHKFPNAVTVVPASVLTNRQPVAPVAAQLRANPQIRALVADSRPGPTMNAAPVATPPAVFRRPDARAPIRPPFEGRAPGGLAGRPGSPAASPGAQAPTAAPQGGQPGGTAPVRPTGPAVAGQAPHAVPAPGAARPEPPRSGQARPGQAAPADPTAIVRPPVRGGVMREPGSEAPALRPGMTANPTQAAPRAVEAVRPTPQTPPGQAAPAAPTALPAPTAVVPADERGRPGRRAPADEIRPPARPAVAPAPPIGVAPRAETPALHPVEPRGADAPRQAPVRPSEARPAETPRGVAPPPQRAVEAPRAVEPPRVIEAPRSVSPPPRAVEPPRNAAPVVVPAAPKQVEPARPEPVRTAPEQRVGRPEAPRREEKRDEKRDEKKDPNEKQR